MVSGQEAGKLRSLMAQDVWLYSYAKLVFEARYNYYKHGLYQKPIRPQIPAEPPCQTTRFILRCKNGPYGLLNYIFPNTPFDHFRVAETFMRPFIRHK